MHHVNPSEKGYPLHRWLSQIMSNFEIQFDFSSPDALSAFVDLLQIDSLLLASFTLGRPAGIASRDEYPVLHFIKNGRAIIVGHGIRHDLEPGDAVLLPRGGRGYVLGTGENVPVVPVEFSPEQKGLCCQRIGGDGPESEFLCCSFRLRYNHNSQLLQSGPGHRRLHYQTESLLSLIQLALS